MAVQEAGIIAIVSSVGNEATSGDAPAGWPGAHKDT